MEVEKHPWWKQLEDALHVREVTEDRDDDELEMTRVERNTVCPISRKEMVKPVKNIICGHVYDKQSMESLLKQNPMCRCPAVGCPSLRSVVRRNLEEDKEMKKFIAGKNNINLC